MLVITILLSNHEEITHSGILDFSISGNYDHLRVHVSKWHHIDYDMSEVEHFEIKMQ